MLSAGEFGRSYPTLFYFQLPLFSFSVYCLFCLFICPFVSLFACCSLSQSQPAGSDVCKRHIPLSQGRKIYPCRLARQQNASNKEEKSDKKLACRSVPSSSLGQAMQDRFRQYGILRRATSATTPPAIPVACLSPQRVSTLC